MICMTLIKEYIFHMFYLIISEIGIDTLGYVYNSCSLPLSLSHFLPSPHHPLPGKQGLM